MFAIIESVGPKILACSVRNEESEAYALAVELAQENHTDENGESYEGAPTADEIRADLRHGYHEAGDYRVTVTPVTP